MTFRPMLACEYDPKKLKYPAIGSPKLDGIRALCTGGVALSRSLKPIPNAHVQSILSHPKLEGMDGELIVGSPTAANCYTNTTSHVMSHDKVFQFHFYVFDLHNSNAGYDVRRGALTQQWIQCGMPAIRLHSEQVLYNDEDLLRYESECLEMGYEGVMLRSLDGKYKYGRSTANEGLLLKVKRFTDSEAEVLGFEEQMENTNEKQINELGRSKRSSHQDGMRGKGTLGALMVRDVKSGVEFSIGTGMNDGIREHIWANRDSHEGKIVKYKSFLIGAVDKPRFPVFLGFRSPLDMS